MLERRNSNPLRLSSDETFFNPFTQGLIQQEIPIFVSFPVGIAFYFTIYISSPVYIHI